MVLILKVTIATKNLFKFCILNSLNLNKLRLFLIFNIKDLRNFFVYK